MKSIRKLLTGMVIIVSLTANLHLLHAQTAGVGNFNSNLSLVQAAVPDDLVQIAADAQNLTLIPPGQAPRSSTFWWILPSGIAVPAPCAPQNDLTAPIYQMASGQFLVDQTGGQIPAIPRRFGMQARATSSTALSGLEIEADTVMNLILRVQSTAAIQQMGMMSRAMGMDVPSFNDTGNGGNGTNDLLFSIDYASLTNGLWLEMTNLSNGYAWLNLRNATNVGGVYEIFSKSDLTAPSWNIEGALWPKDTNCQPFVLSINPQSPTFFVWSRDWTDATSGGNTTPEWWFWQNYGTVDLSDSTLDANGNSLLSDYTNNVVPATFTFSGVQVANNYVSATPATVQLNVTGSPYYMAVLVDDSNFNDAVWTNYTSPNVAVSLWPQGWHDVWIGLRGHADSTNAAVWQWKRLKLDYTSPTLAITGPMVAGGAAATVDVPVIQLTGYSPEALSSISYDLSNTAGTLTNQLAVITGQTYNTGTMEFATNYFKCYDEPLTNGVNSFTFHATDLAGNVTTFATGITVDYSGKTNPPAVALLWPLDGMEICGNNIVCRGQVSDQTVSVAVQLVDANGVTNTAGSLVGRDGIFYADSLTLAAGTNYLSYTVTDAVGNMLSTNITVVTSALGLTLNPVAAGQTLVTGTIDDTNYTVYVNGVQATKDGGGWSATITPIGIGGGAVVVNAIQDGPSLQQIVQPPQGVYTASYYMSNNITSNVETEDPSVPWTNITTLIWRDTTGVTVDGNLFGGLGQYTADGTAFDNFYWPLVSWPQWESPGVAWWQWDMTNGQTWFWGTVVTNSSYPVPVITNCSYTGPVVANEHCDTYFSQPENPPFFYKVRRTADAEMKLATGGTPGSTQKHLWVISASATDADTGLPIPPEQIQIGKLGNLDTNGNLYVVLADNDPIVITPMIAGLYNFLFSPVSAIEYPTAITANGIDLSTNTPDFCVGQYIKFDIAGLPRYRGAEAKWALPGTYVNEQPDPNCDLYYDKTNTLLTPRSWKDKTLSTHCWYVLGESNAQVSVTVIYYDSVAEKTISFTFTGKFNVHRPAVVGQLETVDVDGTPTPMISANGNFLTLGANHNEDMSFEHRINSGNFSGDAGYVQLVGFSDAEYSDHVHSHSSLYLGKLDIDISPSNQLDTLPTFVNPDFPRSTTPIPAFDPLFWVLKKGWTDPFYDAPSVYLADNNEVSYQHLHFQTYLMFKPQDSGYGSSIYVPLQQINWKLYDSGQRANQLFDHTAIITSDSGCATFPHWKRAVDLNANQPEQ